MSGIFDFKKELLDRNALELQEAGLPSELERDKIYNIQDILPKGAKIIGICEPGQREIPYKDWLLRQEIERKSGNKKDENKMSDSLRIDMSKLNKAASNSVSIQKREIKQAFEYGNIVVALCNDDTVWYLDRVGDATVWIKMHDAEFPPIPQGV